MTRIIEQILDQARWAPSGDNTQPWRFEIVDDAHVVVHAFDTRSHCVYDLDGRASQVSVGALLETLRIAASVHGRSVRAVRRPDAPDEQPLIDVWLEASAAVRPDPLHRAIETRSVQRRSLSTRPLGAEAKQALELSVGPGYGVVWFEGWQARLRLARLAARSAKIRLTIPEAYRVHRDVIEWGARTSETRIPDQALGADALSVRSMRWAMTSWERVERMNRFFGGTWLPRLQLDFAPALRCGAHFALVARQSPHGIDDHLAAGAAVQRFWLTATSLGLQLQPQYTPIVFAAYARRGTAFTAVTAARQRALEVAASLGELLGADAAPDAVFLGRVGHGPTAVARSVRLPLSKLIWEGPPSPPAETAASSHRTAVAGAGATATRP